MATVDEIKIVVKAEVDAAIAKMNALDKTAKDNSKSFHDLAKDIAGLTTGYNLGVQAGQAVLRTMGELVVTSVKLAAAQERVKMEFSVLTGSIQIGNRLFNEMNRLAAQTPLEMADITAAGKQLLSVGIPVGQVTEKLRMLGDVAMGNPEKLDRLTSAFAQLKSKGVASMEQLNRFIEAGVPIMAELGKQTGKSGQEIFKMVEKGQIGFKDVEAALRSLTSAGGLMNDMMLKVSETAEGKWSTAMDNFRMGLAEAGKAMLPFLTQTLNDVSMGLGWIQGQGAVDYWTKILNEKKKSWFLWQQYSIEDLEKKIAEAKEFIKTDALRSAYLGFDQTSIKKNEADIAAAKAAQEAIDQANAEKNAFLDLMHAGDALFRARNKWEKFNQEAFSDDPAAKALAAAQAESAALDAAESAKAAREIGERIAREDAARGAVGLYESELLGSKARKTAGPDPRAQAQKEYNMALAASAESMQRIMETGYIDVMTAFGRSLFDSADGADALADSIANLGEALLDAAPGIMLELALKAGAAGNIPAAAGFVAAAGFAAIGGGIVDAAREKKSSTTNVSNVHVYNVQGSVIAQSQLDNMSARASARADRGY